MNILIIGHGSIGKRHYSLLCQHEDFNKVHYVSKYSAGPDNVGEKLEELEESQLAIYDIFLICSETSLHEKQLKCIDKKVEGKVILIEKPLSNERSDFIPKNLVFICYNLRFHPVIQKLNEIMTKEKLLSFSARAGQYLPTWRPDTDYLKSYSAKLSRGGGVLRDLSHEVDYTAWLCGKLSLVSSLATSHSHLRLQADDMCTILATNNNGAHIQIQMDYMSFRPKREIEIQTERNTISACLVKNKIDIYDSTGKVNTIDFGVLERNFTYNAMHTAIANNELHMLTAFSEANDVMDIIDNITNNYMDKKWQQIN